MSNATLSRVGRAASGMANSSVPECDGLKGACTGMEADSAVNPVVNRSSPTEAATGLVDNLSVTKRRWRWGVSGSGRFAEIGVKGYEAIQRVMVVEFYCSICL